VTRKLGRYVRGTTADAALPGTGGDERAIAARAATLGVAEASALHLSRLYGACAGAVLDLVERDRMLAASPCEHAPDIAAQLVHAMRREWAVTIGDALLRRTTLGLAACQALHCLDRVAAIIAAACGWSDDERDRQVAAYRAELAPMRIHSTA